MSFNSVFDSCFTQTLFSVTQCASAIAHTPNACAVTEADGSGQCCHRLRSSSERALMKQTILSDYAMNC